MAEILLNRVNYWLKEAKHDCFFKVGSENGPTERIGAIKHILMADSEPFRVMLGDGELAETGEIRVKDVEPETFRNFLKCVYGASGVFFPKLSFEESAKLLYVFEKYLVIYLRDELVVHMESSFTPESIFVALSHPICHQTATLNKKILEILKYDFVEKVAQNDKFLLLSDSAITWILQQEPINVKEIKIWEAVLQWAEYQTGSKDSKILRNTIFGFLKYIRFLTMDYNEFCEGVISKDILKKKEVDDICVSFVTGKPCTFAYLCKSVVKRFSMKYGSEKLKNSIIQFPKYALIHCSVLTINNLQGSYNSNTYMWAGHLWCLTVANQKNKDTDKYAFGVWLWCDGITSNRGCTVDIELSILNQFGKPDKSKKYSNKFCKTSLNWFFLSFYDWDYLLNPDIGFVKENSLILSARIQLHN